MARDIVETFEGGSDETNCTTSNTAFDGFSATVPVFDSAVAFRGTLSMRCTTSASICNAREDYTLRSNVYVRAFLYFDALPAANTFPLNVNAGATTRAQFRLNTAGTVSLRNGTTAVYTSVATLSTSTWYRVEWDLENGVGQSVRVYPGDSATALISSGSQTFNTGTHDSVLVGYPASTTHTVWFDEVAVDDTANPGPLGKFEPGHVATATTVPAALMGQGNTMTPGHVATATTVPAPAMAGGTGATMTPGRVATATTFPAETITATFGATMTPGHVATRSTVPAPAASGVAPAPVVNSRGWYGLLAIVQEAAVTAAEEPTRRRLACPNDGEPYRTAPDGSLFCPFDGYRP